MMTPARLGFSLPAEWSPQAAIWLSWPVADPRHWGGRKHRLIEEKFAEIAAAISHSQRVCINAEAHTHGEIYALLNKARAELAMVELYNHPHNDVWCRDHGPIFVRHGDTGEVAVTDWEFNAWGGKFPPWILDNEIPARIASALGLKRFQVPMVLEGGAIEGNGKGDLLTTEAVLLNPNRNPTLTRQNIEEYLREFLGVERIHWLKAGIVGDDTDGHIDDLARFTNAETILACVEPDSNSPNHKPLATNLAILKELRPSFAIDTIPLPAACEIPGWRLPTLPASYVNFLVMNHAVLVPTFRQRRNDERALGIIGEHFQGRLIIAIDCLDLVEEGGSLHCISQHQPA